MVLCWGISAVRQMARAHRGQHWSVVVDARLEMFPSGSMMSSMRWDPRVAVMVVLKVTGPPTGGCDRIEGVHPVMGQCHPIAHQSYINRDLWSDGSIVRE